MAKGYGKVSERLRNKYFKHAMERKSGAHRAGPVKGTYAGSLHSVHSCGAWSVVSLRMSTF
jgi:hypothetical protein